jgi:hypothetical protein
MTMIVCMAHTANWVGDIKVPTMRRMTTTMTPQTIRALARERQLRSLDRDSFLTRWCASSVSHVLWYCYHRCSRCFGMPVKFVGGLEINSSLRAQAAVRRCPHEVLGRDLRKYENDPRKGKQQPVDCDCIEGSVI